MRNQTIQSKRLFSFLAAACLFVPAITNAADSAAKLAPCQSKAKNRPMVKLHTTLGVITLELNAEKAPISVANFLDYAKSGFYNGTIFHRVIESFMIQGGGFDKNMHKKPTKAPIKNEAANGLGNDIYTIAMARTPDPQSATAQFFINVKDNSGLNFTSQTPQGWGYAVFGKVVEGMDVVDKIKNVPTGNRAADQQVMADVPVTDVVIEKAQVCTN